MSNQEIETLEQALAEDKQRHEMRPLFPKWVQPHESHIVRKEMDGAPAHVSAPGFSEVHVNRIDGAVTVLVANEDEEARALADASPKEPVAEVVDPATVDHD